MEKKIKIERKILIKGILTMIYKFENLILGNKLEEFFIFDYYDGVKGECNLDKGIILFWYDYDESGDGEYWFLIKTDRNLIKDFLDNKLSALDLFLNENSEVYLYYRDFENYENLKFLKKLDKNELDNYELPDPDAYLSYSVLD